MIVLRRYLVARQHYCVTFCCLLLFQGLLQTIFIVTYMIFAPLFGYLGDRRSRKILMCIGITFWSVTTLLGSFIPQGVRFLLPIFSFVTCIMCEQSSEPFKPES